MPITEDRLIELVMMGSEAIGVVLQWWLGVTFGVLAVAYIAARRLNWLIVIVLSLLYSAHTYLTIDEIFMNTLVIDVLYDEAVRLVESGEHSGVAVQVISSIINQRLPLTNVSWPLTYFGAYFGCLAFLFYSFVRAKRADSN